VCQSAHQDQCRHAVGRQGARGVGCSGAVHTQENNRGAVGAGRQTGGHGYRQWGTPGWLPSHGRDESAGRVPPNQPAAAGSTCPHPCKTGLGEGRRVFSPGPRCCSASRAEARPTYVCFEGVGVGNDLVALHVQQHKGRHRRHHVGDPWRARRLKPQRKQNNRGTQATPGQEGSRKTAQRAESHETALTPSVAAPVAGGHRRRPHAPHNANQTPKADRMRPRALRMRLLNPALLARRLSRTPPHHPARRHFPPALCPPTHRPRVD